MKNNHEIFECSPCINGRNTIRFVYGVIFMGKILVIEGTDCSGKTTQYEKLCERMKKEGVSFATDSFPDYASESSFLVREYLAGKFGTNPADVDGHTASVFYGVDRYHSYMTKEWGRVYREGGNVLFARYITANLLHQSCKLKTEEEKEQFIQWLYDFEVGTLKIPKEDHVILLKVPFEKIKELKAKRGKTSSGAKDIHEEDEEYLKAAYDTSIWMAERLGWTVIECVDEKGDLRSIEDIHEEVYQVAKGVFGI